MTPHIAHAIGRTGEGQPDSRWMKMLGRLCLVAAFLAVLASSVVAQSIPLSDLSFVKKLKLARAGDDVAELAVGMHYERGEGAKQDALEAARWYREATLKGNIEAQFLLAKLISKGAKGLTADKAAAMTLFQSAADRGHANSQNELGLHFQNGDGIPANPSKAAEWYQKAIDQNHAAAMVNLGLLHVRGLGVVRDYGLAVKLFNAAASQGDAWALNNLGSMYEMGWGLPKDMVKAKEHYQQAFALGNALAQKNLSRLDATAAIAPLTNPTPN